MTTYYVATVVFAGLISCKYDDLIIKVLRMFVISRFNNIIERSPSANDSIRKKSSGKLVY